RAPGGGRGGAPPRRARSGRRAPRGPPGRAAPAAGASSLRLLTSLERGLEGTDAGRVGPEVSLADSRLRAHVHEAAAAGVRTDAHDDVVVEAEEPARRHRLELPGGRFLTRDLPVRHARGD